MNVDRDTAAALGFHKPHYTAVERERRWLCSDIPHDRVVETQTITDLYVTGTRLRLREVRPAGGGPPVYKFTRKADVDVHTRLITSIYLAPEEFAILASVLTGRRISKLRHRLRSPPGVPMSVDEFRGGLAGLLLLEVEFETADTLANFVVPSFAGREVTEDVRFTGAHLAMNGLAVEAPS